MNFIDIEQFASVDLRVGTVLEAEEVEGSEKLIKFVIDLGAEQRQVLGGLKVSYAPAELVGKQVIVVANLAPRTMMGLESQGMILAASDESGKPSNTNPMLAKQRPDVYIADGSLAKLPQKAEWAKICHRLGLPTNVVFGCLAETIALSVMVDKCQLCEHYGKPTFIGNPESCITNLVMEQLWRNGMKPFVTPAHR